MCCRGINRIMGRSRMRLAGNRLFPASYIPVNAVRKASIPKPLAPVRIRRLHQKSKASICTECIGTAIQKARQRQTSAPRTTPPTRDSTSSLVGFCICINANGTAWTNIACSPNVRAVPNKNKSSPQVLPTHPVKKEKCMIGGKH